jgi:hypothetical protein
MNKELESYLVKKYPLIFKNIGGDPTKTPMCFGIECGSGWFWLIDTACFHIQATYESAVRQREIDLDELKPLKERSEMFPDGIPEIVCPSAAQIKEKFGTLRFYVNDAGADVFGDTSSFITMAESMSYRTCENCGCPGSVSYGGWYRCLCSKCSQTRDEEKWDAYKKRGEDFVEQTLAMLKEKEEEEMF